MRTATNDLRALSACALVICLSACDPATPPTSPATAPTTRTTATPAPSAPEQVKNTASSLQTLLSVFAGQTAEDWSAFDNLSGVRWSDPKPLDNPDSVSPDATHYRGGDMLLAGFGEVDVPDGKVGAEAGIRKDNEGHVGVVLHGNANTVQSIALQKLDRKSVV